MDDVVFLALANPWVATGATPDPSLNDQTANLGGAIGGEVKHQHPYDQNPKVNGQMARPLSPWLDELFR